MRPALVLALALLAGSAAAAQAVKAGALSLSDLQLRASLGHVPTSAAYLTIANDGAAPDRLESVDCACAASVMMHRSATKDGVSTMEMVDSLTVPAHGRLVFSPDSLHIMLMGLKAPLKAGGKQVMTLHFARAGAVKAAFPITDVIASPQAGMTGMAGMADMPGMAH